MKLRNLLFAVAGFVAMSCTETDVTEVALQNNEIFYTTRFNYILEKDFTDVVGFGAGLTKCMEQGYDNYGYLRFSNTVNNIPVSAFKDCASLKTIYLPSTVYNIQDSAFYACSGLTSIDIPKYVSTIGNNAFNGCTSLDSIQIPEYVKTVGEFAFYRTKWYNNQESGLLYLDGWCLGYKGEKPGGELKLNVNTECIANAAFFNCSKLTRVTITENVKSIGASAFEGCTTLNSITIPKNVETIGNYAFYNSGINEIYCTSQTPPTISHNTFARNWGLKIYVPSEAIEQYKIKWASYASYIYIP